MFGIYNMKTALKIFFGRDAKAVCFSKKPKSTCWIRRGRIEDDIYQQWRALGSSATGGKKLGRAAIRNVLEEENIFFGWKLVSTVPITI